MCGCVCVTDYSCYYVYIKSSIYLPKGLIVRVKTRAAHIHTDIDMVTANMTNTNLLMLNCSLHQNKKYEEFLYSAVNQAIIPLNLLYPLLNCAISNHFLTFFFSIAFRFMSVDSRDKLNWCAIPICLVTQVKWTAEMMKCNFIHTIGKIPRFFAAASTLSVVSLCFDLHFYNSFTLL